MNMWDIIYSSWLATLLIQRERVTETKRTNYWNINKSNTQPQKVSMRGAVEMPMRVSLSVLILSSINGINHSWPLNIFPGFSLMVRMSRPIPHWSLLRNKVTERVWKCAKSDVPHEFGAPFCNLKTMMFSVCLRPENTLCWYPLKMFRVSTKLHNSHFVRTQKTTALPVQYWGLLVTNFNFTLFKKLSNSLNLISVLYNIQSSLITHVWSNCPTVCPY